MRKAPLLILIVTGVVIGGALAAYLAWPDSFERAAQELLGTGADSAADHRGERAPAKPSPTSAANSGKSAPRAKSGVHPMSSQRHGEPGAVRPSLVSAAPMAGGRVLPGTGMPGRGPRVFAAGAVDPGTMETDDTPRFFGIPAPSAGAVFVVDTSATMLAPAPRIAHGREYDLSLGSEIQHISRLLLTLDMVKKTARSLPSTARVGLVTFGDTAESRLKNSDGSPALWQLSDARRTALQAALTGIRAAGRSNVAAGLSIALDLLDGGDVRDVFFVTDGPADAGSLTDPGEILGVVAPRAVKLGIRIHVIEFPIPENQRRRRADALFGKQLASRTGGQHPALGK